MMAATTVWPSIALPSRRTPMQNHKGRQFELCPPRISQGPVGYRESSQGPVLRGNIQPWDGRKPAWGYACQGEPCSARRLWRLSFTVLWTQISRTTSTTLPNRLRSGPKLPSQVISDRTEAYLAKWSNPFPHYQYTHMHICIYIYIYKYIYVSIYTYIYIYNAIYIHMYVYVNISIDKYVYVYIHIYIYVYIHIYIHMYMYIHIFICVQLYIYITVFMNKY